MTDGEQPEGDDTQLEGDDTQPEDDDTEGLSETYSEPEEYDPTDQFGDPERDLVSTPSVRNPADSLPSPDEVDTEIRQTFWRAVLLTNVALAGTVLGPVYAVVQGDLRVGGAVTAAGVVASVRVYQTVRAFHRRHDDEA